MYYGENTLSSVYIWDIDNGFAAAILFKKIIKEITKVVGMQLTSWKYAFYY